MCATTWQLLWVRARTAWRSTKVSPSSGAATPTSASQSPRETLNPFAGARSVAVAVVLFLSSPRCRRRCWHRQGRLSCSELGPLVSVAKSATSVTARWATLVCCVESVGPRWPKGTRWSLRHRSEAMVQLLTRQTPHRGPSVNLNVSVEVTQHLMH